MNTETQDIEYKDYSKNKAPEKKEIVSKLFREISAFANSTGGKIVVGKEDKTGVVNVQPPEILQWLENDYLTAEINRISDNLVVFTSEQKEEIITITIQESADVISAGIDYKKINKGDCFIRENHQAILARGNTLKRLIETKAISTNSRLEELRKIVHHKFAVGENSATHMNIFDSLVVGIDSQDEYISTVFDSLVKNQFIGGYCLPLSKHSTIQMHIEIMASIVNTPEGSPNNSVVTKREAFNKLVQSSHFTVSFFESHRDKVLKSQELKNYILEYRGLMER